METGARAVELLISNDQKLATGISKEINNYNNERRSVDRVITNEAMRMISEDQWTSNAKTTVLFNPSWKKELSELSLHVLLRLITDLLLY